MRRADKGCYLVLLFLSVSAWSILSPLVRSFLLAVVPLPAHRLVALAAALLAAGLAYLVIVLPGRAFLRWREGREQEQGDTPSAVDRSPGPRATPAQGLENEGRIVESYAPQRSGRHDSWAPLARLGLLLGTARRSSAFWLISAIIVLAVVAAILLSSRQRQSFRNGAGGTVSVPAALQRARAECAKPPIPSLERPRCGQYCPEEARKAKREIQNATGQSPTGDACSQLFGVDPFWWYFEAGERELAVMRQWSEWAETRCYEVSSSFRAAKDRYQAAQQARRTRSEVGAEVAASLAELPLKVELEPVESDADPDEPRVQVRWRIPLTKALRSALDELSRTCDFSPLTVHVLLVDEDGYEVAGDEATFDLPIVYRALRGDFRFESAATRESARRAQVKFSLGKEPEVNWEDLDWL